MKNQILKAILSMHVTQLELVPHAQMVNLLLVEIYSMVDGIIIFALGLV